MTNIPNPRIAHFFANAFANRVLLFRYAFVALMLWIPCGGLARQSGTHPEPFRITILLIPGLRADDIEIAKLPALVKLVESGESGWMVCRGAKPADPDQLRTDGREPIDSLMLSLGCGGRARCGPEADGIVAPTPHNLHVLPYPPPGSIDALKKANLGLGYTLHIGALGDIAHTAGLTTAAIGNMDAERPDRSLYLMVMDSRGIVDDAGPRLGKVLSDDTAPFGITSNVEATIAAYDGIAARDHVRLIAAGDLYRADRYEGLCLPGVASIHRANALTRINRLIEQISARIAAENAAGIVSRLIVTSPGPANSTTNPHDTLAPIVLWGGGVFVGSVTSLSTHRPGLVANTDVLATVAAWFRQPLPAGATGRPIVAGPRSSSQTDVNRLRFEHDSLVNTATLQNILGGLPTVQVALLVLGFAAARWRPDSALSISLRGAIGAVIASLPLGMLILPTLHPASPLIASLYLLVFELICSGTALRRPQTAAPIVATLSGALVGLICLDLATGCRLLQSAWMSYSAADGARFYGIGNEYMGAAIGAMIVLFPRFAGVTNPSESGAAGSHLPGGSMNIAAVRTGRGAGRKLYYLGFTVMILLMAAPFAGAKAGSVPSAGAAGAALLLIDRRGRIAAKDLFMAASVLLLILASAVFLDSRGSQSHLIRSLTGSGGDEISVVIRRKLAMELHLVLHSPWMVTLAAAAWVLAAQGRRIMKCRDPMTARAVLAGLWCGAAACLIFNDAGVLAAAMVLLFGCAWALTPQRTPAPAARLSSETPEATLETNIQGETC